MFPPSDAVTVLDVGCGPCKTPGAWGIDHHPYPGVDQVVDLDACPWPLPDGHFRRIIAHQVIEHIASIPRFLSEIHRIAVPEAEVLITTPHCSSPTSWRDPTHRWHLSASWHSLFTSGDSYLMAQLPPFRLVESRVEFTRHLFGRLGRLVVWAKGVDWWEDHGAWVLPAQTVWTTLRVVK